MGHECALNACRKNAPQQVRVARNTQKKWQPRDASPAHQAGNVAAIHKSGTTRNLASIAAPAHQTANVAAGSFPTALDKGKSIMVEDHVLPNVQFGNVTLNNSFSALRLRTSPLVVSKKVP